MGNKEFDDICRMVDEHDWISFDVYDTAILRNVLFPDDLFEIAERQNSVSNFKKIRIQAEEQARSRSNREDISFQEIYQVINEKLGFELSKALKETELTLEREFSIANPFILKVYQYAVSRNKKVIFISDMYLPKSFISGLLVDNGYDQFEHVFVSSEVGLSKATMNMYGYVKEKLQLDECSSILHIGDNIVSDYKCAMKSGFSAYYYRSVRERAGIEKRYSLDMSIIKAIQINYCYTTEECDYWQTFAITKLSALYFGFTLWLAKNLIGKDNAYFLSRDGYLPYKIYEKLSKVMGNLPEARYLYASRRIYQFPNFLNMDKDEVLDIITKANDQLGQILTLGEIFDNLGLERNKYVDRIKEYGFDSYAVSISSEKIREKVKKVLLSLLDDIEPLLKQERDLLIEYLKQNDVYRYSQLNIVDVGWRGSVHKAIQDITGIPVEGYYLGTAFNVYDDIRSSVHGYLFQLGKPYTEEKKIMDNVMMYEFIFSAPHGTLIGFAANGQRIEPVLKEDDANTSQCIDIMHKAVLFISDRFLKYYKYIDKIDATEAVFEYQQFIEEKKYDDLVQFNRLSLSVGIGDSPHYQRFVTTVSIEDYMKNKKKVLMAADKNLWRGALIVRGSVAEFKKGNCSFIHRMNIVNRTVSKDKIIRALKNPRKAFRYVVRKLSSFL